MGWDYILEHEHALGQRFLERLPDSCELYGIKTMEARVPTFAFNVAGRTPEEVAVRLGDAGYAVWHGNYYAVEIFDRLGLPDGAVRVGICSYNSADEVDGLLDELQKL